MSESISGQWNGGRGWVPRTFVMQKVWEKKTEEEGITEANR